MSNDKSLYRSKEHEETVKKSVEIVQQIIQLLESEKVPIYRETHRRKTLRRRRPLPGGSRGGGARMKRIRKCCCCRRGEFVIVATSPIGFGTWNLTPYRNKKYKKYKKGYWSITAGWDDVLISGRIDKNGKLKNLPDSILVSNAAGAVLRVECREAITTPQLGCCKGELLALDAYGQVFVLEGQEFVRLNEPPQTSFEAFRCRWSPYRYERYEGREDIGRVYYLPFLSTREIIIEENVYENRTWYGMPVGIYEYLGGRYAVLPKTPFSDNNHDPREFVVYCDGKEVGNFTLPQYFFVCVGKYGLSIFSR